jgi:hypothetical protein
MAEPTTKDLVLQELAQLRGEVATVAGTDTEEMQRALLRLRDIRQLFRLRPLDERERIRLRKKIQTTLRTRSNNYKMGTVVQGVRGGQATLKLHYAEKVRQKLDQMCGVLYAGQPLPCSGVSSPDAPRGVCASMSLLDPHNLAMESFHSDHWYEQDSINRAMLEALGDVCEGEQRFTVAFVRAHLRDPADSDASRDVLAFLQPRVDLERYRDDLFGSNLYLRCTACTKLCLSSRLHPQAGIDRYLL